MKTTGGWIYCDRCGERTAMLSGVCLDCKAKEDWTLPKVQEPTTDGQRVLAVAVGA